MIHVWGITDKGAVRTQNQDCFYLKEIESDLVTVMVCDGMGGHRAGNVASMLAVNVASAYLESLTPEELAEVPNEHLVRCANLSNEAVYQKAEQDPDCAGMGTTLVSAIVIGEKAYILNVGDSRAYHIGEEGIVKISRDHSVVEDMVYRGDITPEEARLHPQKNLITRALGGDIKVEPDLYEKELKAGEFLLLCTDGLTNILTDQEILYEVLHGGAPEGCCQRMMDLALVRGASDNVTVVLIQKQ